MSSVFIIESYIICHQLTHRMTANIVHLLVFALVLAMFTTHQALGADHKKEKEVIIEKCLAYIKHGGHPVYNPKPDCRHAIEQADMVGVCGVITSVDEHKISIYKLIELCFYVHKPIPAKTKCGSKYPFTVFHINLYKLVKEW